MARARGAPAALIAVSVVLLSLQCSAASPVRAFTLGNGLKVLIDEDHSRPRVALSVAYGAGTRDEPDGAPCLNASGCASFECVDGVCCDRPSTGSCEACTAAKKGHGPDGACDTVNHAAPCGVALTSDAAGVCKY